MLHDRYYWPFFTSRGVKCPCSILIFERTLTARWIILERRRYYYSYTTPPTVAVSTSYEQSLEERVFHHFLPAEVYLQHDSLASVCTVFFCFARSGYTIRYRLTSPLEQSLTHLDHLPVVVPEYAVVSWSRLLITGRAHFV